MATPRPAQLRSLYRRLLREMPSRTPSILGNPSPIQLTIRANFEAPPAASQSRKTPLRRLAEAEQYLQYLKAQRTYTTLLERYNPGMNMQEEERVRLTARRVGLDVPDDLAQQQGKKE